MKSQLRQLLKRVVYAGLLKPLPRPFRHEQGFCWSCQAPRGLTPASENGDRPLVVLEDRQYLGPGHTQRDIIEQVGRGWFASDGERLYFSTSDNSDPNQNGRQYACSTSTWLWRRQSGVPSNFRRQSITPEQLAEDVVHLFNGERYLDGAREIGLDSLQGLRVLELGPGKSYGWAVLLACTGAQVIAADLYPSAWEADYHGPLYQRVRERMADDDRFDVGPIDRLLESGRFCEDVVQVVHSPAETLTLPEASVDVVFSNAVVEHLYDHRLAFEKLFRITRPGGYSLHWIDFRDHRDFTRPLEYLLMSRPAFEKEFGMRKGEMGHQLRPAELEQIVREIGFEVVRSETALEADPEYLADFQERLQATPESPYHNYTGVDLPIIGNFLCLRRPD